jgi:pilus assembly protein CpaE
MEHLLVRLETKDAALSNELEKIIKSVSGLKMLRPDDARRADLLIYELGPDIENDFQLIESLLAVNMVGEVILTAKSSDPKVLLRAIQLGAKEFLTQPCKAEQVIQALEKLKKNSQQVTPQREFHKFGKIISLLGAKGGVGTTTLAVNLAVELAQKQPQPSVVLIDMNFMFGEIPIFLEIKSKYHMGEIAKHIARLDPTFLMDILSKHASGVYVLPSETFLDGAEKTNPKTVERVLGLMRRMFDFVLIDAGNFVTENFLKVCELSDLILITSVLSLPCLSNASRLLSSFNNQGSINTERIKVVINRYEKKSQISMHDAEVALKKEIFFSIPNDYTTAMNSINNGQPISTISANTEIAKSFKDLAERFIEKPLAGHQQQEEVAQTNSRYKWMKVFQRA